MSDSLPRMSALEGRTAGLYRPSSPSSWEPIENVKIGGELRAEGFEETDGEDRWQQTLANERYAADAGLPMADFECRHGSLPTDTNVQCQCFVTEETTLLITKGQIVALATLAYQVGAGRALKLSNYGAMGALALIVDDKTAYVLPADGGAEPLDAVPVE